MKVDDVLLENVTHEFAVNTLKQTAAKVTLYYLKNPHPELIPITLDDSVNRSMGALSTPARSGNFPILLCSFESFNFVNSNYFVNS